MKKTLIVCVFTISLSAGYEPFTLLIAAQKKQPVKAVDLRGGALSLKGAAEWLRFIDKRLPDVCFLGLVLKDGDTEVDRFRQFLDKFLARQGAVVYLQGRHFPEYTGRLLSNETDWEARMFELSKEGQLCILEKYLGRSG